MGANCCRCKKGSVVSDNLSDFFYSDRLGDHQSQPAATPTLTLNATRLTETRAADEPSSQQALTPTLTPLKANENFVFGVWERGESSNANASIRNIDEDGYRASNTFWTTGSFSDPIPDGFYSVIPNDRLKLYENIPPLDKLRVMGDKGLKGDVIHVDFKNDNMLSRLKELINALVEGLNLNQAAVINEIVDLIITSYERYKLESSAKAERSRIQLLGDNNLVSSRARAMLFKALADHVGLQSRIILGYPSDPGSSASVDSQDQMYVVVVDNAEEMMVDLMQSPGQLIRLERIEHESSENDENVAEHMLVEPSGPPSELQPGLRRLENDENIPENRLVEPSGPPSASTSPPGLEAASADRVV